MARDTAAQVLQDLTPEQVRAALADEKAKGCYPLKGAAGACFTTPYSRVVALAANARRLHKAVIESDITTEMIAPGELHIHAFRAVWVGMKWGVARVQEAALLPAKSDDFSRAIEPTRTITPGTWTIEDRYKSIAGKEHPEFATADRTLVFPLSALSQGNELHILFDHPVSCTYFMKTRCKGRFNLKGVR